MSSVDLIQYFENQRDNTLQLCLSCGICFQNCSMYNDTETQESPQSIQNHILSFLQNPAENSIAYASAFSCLHCFKCIKDSCPVGLVPMYNNILIKWEFRRKGIHIKPYGNPQADHSAQRILSSIQLTESEYKTIFHKSNKKQAKLAFFPGCNVYFQPEKILSACDILDLLNIDYMYIPGLDFCCGNTHLFYGDVEAAQCAINQLLDELISNQIDTLILWCPTCLCEFTTIIAQLTDMPFSVISFAQFVANHMENLPIKHAINKTVTLHEPCKLAFTGFDVLGSRTILSQIPGIELIEMEHSAKNTMCCGLGAQLFSHKLAESIRSRRFQEADDTHADILVDVCHACHDFFVEDEANLNFKIMNYVSIIAKALGIEREDKYKKYIQLNNLQAILNEANTAIEISPYKIETIISAIEENIVNR
ncbi:MAG: (Fe-S)-binding protein [Anaerolineaceae bacterium]|nr:(Fe-S)-binding protein [Anaerolineaceae bacterium]